jgi:hypothetical protein
VLFEEENKASKASLFIKKEKREAASTSSR